MAQLALAVTGAAIGSLFGAPQLGFAIFSVLGGALFAPDVQGPRISDTTVQLASYGAPLARVWGSDAIAGSLIWAGPLQETAQEQGGKGGPTVTTYSYARSFAVAIGAPVTSIRRIWADAKLVYDVRDGVDYDAQAATAALLERMTFYAGTESQTADPVIEAVEGVGNVEAYRGTAYVVFDSLPLAEFGNRIPNFRFEVSNQAETTATATVLAPLKVYRWEVGANGPVHSVGDTTYSSTTGSAVTGTDFTTVAAAEALSYSSNPSNYGYQVAGNATSWCGFFSTSVSDNVIGYLQGYGIPDDPETMLIRLCAPLPKPMAYTPFVFVAFAGTLGLAPRSYEWVDYPAVGGSGEYSGYRISYPNPFSLSPSPNPPDPNWNLNLSSGTESGSGDSQISSILYISTILTIEATRVPTVPPNSCELGDPSTRPEGLAQIPDNADWCIDTAGNITPNYTWVEVSGTAKQLCAVEYRDGALYQNALGPVLLPADPNYSSGAYWDAQAAAAIAAGTMQADVSYPVVVTSYAEGTPPTVRTVAAGSALLSAIVSDLCVEAGLSTGQIDVTALTDTVLGFTRTRRMPARAAIETLRTAYWFDAVESGDQIKFVKRGGASIASIGLDDLAAGVDQAAEQPVSSERGQEGELPRGVVISYKAQAADYETGTQQSQRRVVDSDQLQSQEVAVVLTDERAAQVCDVLLYDAWASRTTRTVSVTRKWSKVEPTDVITVDDGVRSYRLRVVDKTEQGGVIELQCRDDDADLYTPNSTGGTISGGVGPAGVAGPTRLALLDIPLLQDSDTGAGPYVAAAGFTDAWAGGRLYRSLDGSTYTALQDLDLPSVIGATENALGDYVGGNTIDWVNHVDVQVTGGELSSITTAALLNNGNPCVIGDEVLQFKTATLLAAGRYRLTGLLRGRLGTEQYMGTHVDIARFVLLTRGALTKPAFELSNLNLALDYKAVSLGDSIAGTGSVEHTQTGACLKPLAPVHLQVVAAAGGGYLVTWVRRTRMGQAWADGGDVPVGEASESYRVRIVWGDTVVESQTVTTNTATVGVGLTAVTGRTVEVCQLSDAVGPGFPATYVFP